MAELDCSEPGAVAVDDVHRPAIALPEETANRQPQHVIGLPGDDAHVDAIAVAQPPGHVRGGVEVDAHVDALLLDAERGDLGEAGQLDAADAAVQRLLAAPAFDEHGATRVNRDGVGREHVGDDLEVGRIAHVEQRLAGGHDGLALVMAREDDALDG